MRLLKPVFAGCCLLLCSSALAQITIEAGDLPQTIGDSSRYKYLQHEATVDVGPSGGPHTWTFDTSTYVGYVLTTTFVDKATTPFADLFPDANIATMEPRGSYTLYVYNRLSPDKLEECGYGLHFGGGGKAGLNVPFSLGLKLPLSLDTAWTDVFSMSDTSADTVRATAHERWCEVDAWGTAETPVGSYPCLRKKQYEFEVTATFVNGMFVDLDSVMTLRYYWFAKGAGMVAMMHSMEDDTSSNFTQADDIMVLVQTGACGVAESRRAEVRRFPEVRPNPCPGRAVLECAPGFRGPVSVRICDAAGRIVLKQLRQTGHGSPVELDLRSLPAGVYLCAVTAGEKTAVRRLIRM